MMGALLKASKKVWIARKVRWASTGGRGKTGGKAVDTVPALSLKRTHRHIKDLTAEDLIPMVGNEGDEESSVFYRSLKRSVSTSEPRISEDPNLQLPLRELKPRKDKRRPDENRGIRGVVPHEIVPSSGRATAMQEVERHLEATLQKPYADQRTGPSRRALAEKDSIKQKTMLNRFKGKRASETVIDNVYPSGSSSPSIPSRERQYFEYQTSPNHSMRRTLDQSRCSAAPPRSSSVSKRRNQKIPTTQPSLSSLHCKSAASSNTLPLPLSHSFLSPPCSLTLHE